MIQGQDDGAIDDLKIYPAPFRDFISPKTRKRIFWSVVGAHVAVIVLPFLWFSLVSLLTPPTIKVLKVSVKDFPSDFPLPSKSPSKTNPTPPADAANIPDPGPLSDVPEPQPDPDPTPAPPKPTPAPPKPTPTPPKPTPVKQPKEDKKPAKDAKEAKEEPKKPEKKKPSLDDIRNAGQVVKSTPAKKPPKGGGGPLVDPNQLRKDLKNGIYQPPGGGGGPIGEVGDPNQNDEYFAKVSSFLYGHWQQPSKALLGNQKPSVEVKISVAANGQIVSATIVGRSGVQLMDASVERLFAEIRALPVPPKAMEFTFKMVIIDE